MCTTSKDFANDKASPRIFTSYLSSRHGSHLRDRVKIWEAVRATSAATGFFEPITIDDQTFIDGATTANNPTKQVWLEAEDIWRDPKDHKWTLEDHVECVVSIGTGIASFKSLGDSVPRVVKALVKIATDCEQVAEEFRREHRSLDQRHRLFRFNARGLEDVGLEEVSKMGAIESATHGYLGTQETHSSIALCCSLLKTRHECKANQSFLRYNCSQLINTRLINVLANLYLLSGHKDAILCIQKHVEKYQKLYKEDQHITDAADIELSLSWVSNTRSWDRWIYPRPQRRSDSFLWLHGDNQLPGNAIERLISLKTASNNCTRIVAYVRGNGSNPQTNGRQTSSDLWSLIPMVASQLLWQITRGTESEIIKLFRMEENTKLARIARDVWASDDKSAISPKEQADLLSWCLSLQKEWEVLVIFEKMDPSTVDDFISGLAGITSRGYDESNRATRFLLTSDNKTGWTSKDTQFQIITRLTECTGKAFYPT